MAQAKREGDSDFPRKHGLLRHGLVSFRGVPIRIRLLGTAAGGGLPQWNCSCRNCLLAREGTIPSRTQSNIAVSADGTAWFIVNASPDLRTQIEAFPALHPTPKTPRNSPIAGVLLTNADLDHVLGLYLLREGNAVSLHATESVFRVLEKDLRLIDVLKASCQVEHHVPSDDSFQPLLIRKGQPSGLQYRAITLSDRRPPYASGAPSPGEAQSVAYEIIDERTQGRLVVAPDVASITPRFLAAMNEADAVLFDGTFWSKEELQNLTGKIRSAEDMGHLTIRDGSLGVLAGLKARTKIYLHINNTNPILDPESMERAEVERAGVVVGHDGLDFEL